MNEQKYYRRMEWDRTTIVLMTRPQPLEVHPLFSTKIANSYGNISARSP